MDGGHVVVRPYVSADAPTSRPNQVEFLHIEPSGATYAEYRLWTGGGAAGTVGASVAAPVSFGTTTLIPVTRDPVYRTWGTSVYADVASPILELSKRFTMASDALDKNQKPVLLWWESTEDLEGRFAPLDPEDPADPTDAEKAAGIVYGLEQARRQSVLGMPDQSLKAEYLQFEGGMEASFAQVELAKELLNILTGVPALLSREDMPMSGTALKLQNQPLYATTRAILIALRERLEEALEYIFGGEQTVTWEHPWDADDSDVQEPELMDPDELGEDT